MATHIEPILTVDDLDVMPDDGNRYEVIEGELFMSCAPNLVHQIVSTNLSGDIRAYLKQNPIGKVIATPGVILSKYNGVIPDLVFVSNERFEEIASGGRLMGAPELVVEILSPGTENMDRDRVAKRHLYAKYGIKEYWIIDPEMKTIELYRLQKRGLRLVKTLSGEDEITSPLMPGFACKANAVFEI